MRADGPDLLRDFAGRGVDVGVAELGMRHGSFDGAYVDAEHRRPGALRLRGVGGAPVVRTGGQGDDDAGRRDGGSGARPPPVDARESRVGGPRGDRQDLRYSS